MDPFSYLSVLISIVLALGMTRVLAGVGEMMQATAAAWDSNKPMNAQKQWTEHAAFMNRLAADGFVVLGGPLGDSGDVLLIIDAADANQINAAVARSVDSIRTARGQRYSVVNDSSRSE